jgi:hypothetical protein
MHKRVSFGLTVCGLLLHRLEKSDVSPLWPGVTCEKCLAERQKPRGKNQLRRVHNRCAPVNPGGSRHKFQY